MSNRLAVAKILKAIADERTRPDYLG